MKWILTILLTLILIGCNIDHTLNSNYYKAGQGKNSIIQLHNVEKVYIYSSHNGKYHSIAIQDRRFRGIINKDTILIYQIIRH